MPTPEANGRSKVADEDILDAEELDEFGNAEDDEEEGIEPAKKKPATVADKKIDATKTVKGEKVKGEKGEKDEDEEEETVKHVHSTKLLRRAAAVGIKAADAESVEPEELEDRVYVAEREAVAELRARAALAEKKPEPAKAKADEEVAIDWGTFEIEVDGEKIKVTEDKINPAIVKVVKDLKKEIRDLKTEVAAKESQRAAASEQTLEQQLDTAMDRHEFLGKGTAATLQGTKYLKRRVSVYMQLKAMSPEDRAATTIRDAVDSIADELYDSKPGKKKAEEAEEAEPAKKKPAAKTAAEKFKDGRTATPTGRKGPEAKKSRAKAEQTVQEFLDGLADDDDDGSDDDDDGEY
jgi:hypothetical protein